MESLCQRSTAGAEMSTSLSASLRLLPFVVALGLMLLVPRFEQFFFPVVRDFTVMGVDTEPEAITIKGYMRKVRDCQVLGLTVMSVDRTGAATEVPIIFLDRPQGGVSRPVGSQGWGPWKVTVKASDVDLLRLTVTHRCHWFYSSDTVLANIPLREY